MGGGNMESRMDRIERNLAEFFRGLEESKARFEKEMAESKARFEKEMAESNAKSEREWAESRKKMDELWEMHRVIGEELRGLRASQEETDRRIRKLKESQEKTDKQLANQGFVQGEVAEDLFYRNVQYLFEKKMKFGNVVRNLKKPGTAEYDIVAFNDDKILVVEVKNKLLEKMVDDFVERRLPKFRKVFPEYAHCRLIGGMGSLVVKDEVGEYAERAGLYVLTQKGDGGATLINRKHFRPKVF
jgi:hypothetical protein